MVGHNIHFQSVQCLVMLNSCIVRMCDVFVCFSQFTTYEILRRDEDVSFLPDRGSPKPLFRPICVLVGWSERVEFSEEKKKRRALPPLAKPNR